MPKGPFLTSAQSPVTFGFMITDSGDVSPTLVTLQEHGLSVGTLLRKSSCSRGESTESRFYKNIHSSASSEGSDGCLLKLRQCGQYRSVPESGITKLRVLLPQTRTLNGKSSMLLRHRNPDFSAAQNSVLLSL